MDTDIMRARFAQIVKKILLERDLSQQELADRYLGVSQACIRDYVGGEKTPPSKVRLITMIKIAELYGTTVDDLWHYLRTGRWKRRMSVQDVESFIRSIEEPRVLINLIGLVHSILQGRMDQLPQPESKPEFNRCSKILELIEEEKGKVESDFQWETLLRAFEISEEEMENLYLGDVPTLSTFTKLSKILRLSIDELQAMILESPSSVVVSKIPVNADQIEQCIDGAHCGEEEQEESMEPTPIPS
jgi:predicted XRE-type DNA-binding protein